MLWRRKRRGRMATAHRKFQERAARARRRPWRFVAAFAAILLVLGGVVYLFGWSDAFLVEEVAVVEREEGPPVEQELSEAALALAAVPTGVPLARVDTAAAEQRVLQDLRIEQVQVRRSWPSTITVELTPRTPAIAVVQSGEPLQLADGTGLIYTTVPQRPSGVPQLRVPSGEVDRAAVAGALALREALPDDLEAQVRNLRVRGNGTLDFNLGRVSVAWGPAQFHSDKALVLSALLQQESIDPEDEDHRIRIDLTVPTTPVVTGMPVLQD